MWPYKQNTWGNQFKIAVQVFTKFVKTTTEVADAKKMAESTYFQF